MTKKKLSRRTNKPINWKILSVIFAAAGIFLYTFRSSIPLFQPASVNKIIEEDPSTATTDEEKEAIDAVNEAANREARTRPGTAAHDRATRDLLVRGQVLQTVRTDSDGNTPGTTTGVNEQPSNSDRKYPRQPNESIDDYLERLETEIVVPALQEPGDQVGEGSDAYLDKTKEANLLPGALPEASGYNTKKPVTSSDKGTTGSSCTGAFGSVPSGTWVATGYARSSDTGARCTEANMQERNSKCTQDECVYCSGIPTDGNTYDNVNDTGYLLDNDKTGDKTKYQTASCGDKLKEDPRKVIMPPDPSSRFWTGAYGTAAIKPPAACVGNMPSGTVSGNNTCFNGRMVPNNQLGSAISQYCTDNNASTTDCQTFANDYTGCKGNSHFDTATSKCVANEASKPTTANVVPTDDKSCKAKMGQDYYWNAGMGCIKGSAPATGKPIGTIVNSAAECASGKTNTAYYNGVPTKVCAETIGAVVSSMSECATGYGTYNVKTSKYTCSTCTAGINRADSTGSSYYTCNSEGRPIYNSCGNGKYIPSAKGGKCDISITNVLNEELQSVYDGVKDVALNNNFAQKGDLEGDKKYEATGDLEGDKKYEATGDLEGDKKYEATGDKDSASNFGKALLQGYDTVSSSLQESASTIGDNLQDAPSIPYSETMGTLGGAVIGLGGGMVGCAPTLLMPPAYLVCRLGFVTAGAMAGNKAGDFFYNITH